MWRKRAGRPTRGLRKRWGHSPKEWGPSYKGHRKSQNTPSLIRLIFRSVEPAQASQVPEAGSSLTSLGNCHGAKPPWHSGQAQEGQAGDNVDRCAASLTAFCEETAGSAPRWERRVLFASSLTTPLTALHSNRMAKPAEIQQGSPREAVGGRARGPGTYGPTRAVHRQWTPAREL